MNNQAAQTMPETLKAIADNIDRLAFSLPAPNEVTPELVGQAIHLRTFAAALAQTAGVVELPAVQRCKYVGGSYPMRNDPAGDYVDYEDHVAIMESYGRACYDAGVSKAAGKLGGYALVPMEPTRAMVNAGWTSCERMGDTYVVRDLTAAYRAMLAAAPAASGVDTSTNEAWAARAQEKIAAMDAAASVSERAPEYDDDDAPQPTAMDIRYAEGYSDGVRDTEQALTQQRGSVAWTHDAETWGNALNDAAWMFVEQCPEKSALLFNNTKGPLRAAILRYAELVGTTTPQPSADAVRELVRRAIAALTSHGQYDWALSDPTLVEELTAIMEERTDG